MRRPSAAHPLGTGGMTRHLNAMWADVLRRFREHLHTTSEDTDGRIR
jgi:hypothetical protein